MNQNVPEYSYASLPLIAASGHHLLHTLLAALQEIQRDGEWGNAKLQQGQLQQGQ